MALGRALSAAIGPQSAVGSQHEGITSPQNPIVPVDVLSAIISRLERLEEAVTRVGDGLQSSREDYAKLSDRIGVIEVTLKSWDEYPPDRVEAQYFDLASGATTPRGEEHDPTRQWMYGQRVGLPTTGPGHPSAGPPPLQQTFLQCQSAPQPLCNNLGNLEGAFMSTPSFRGTMPPPLLAHGR